MTLLGWDLLFKIAHNGPFFDEVELDLRVSSHIGLADTYIAFQRDAGIALEGEHAIIKAKRAMAALKDATGIPLKTQMSDAADFYLNDPAGSATDIMQTSFQDVTDERLLTLFRQTIPVLTDLEVQNGLVTLLAEFEHEFNIMGPPLPTGNITSKPPEP